MKANNKTKQITLGGLLAAGALVALLMASFFSTAILALSAVAGIFVAATVLFTNIGTGILVYCTVSILGWLVVPNKVPVILFAILFGLYSIIKGLIEKPKKKTVQWGIKLLFFNTMLYLFYLIPLTKVFFTAFTDWIGGNGWLVLLLILLLNFVFVVYDMGMTNFLSFLRIRIQKRKM